MKEATIYCNYQFFGHIYVGRLFSYDLEEEQHYYLNSNGLISKLYDMTEEPISETTERYEFKDRLQRLNLQEFAKLGKCNLSATINLYPFNKERLTEHSPHVNAIFSQGNLIGFATL
jgi:hypothetical protein